jgi:hypothetical protein
MPGGLDATEPVPLPARVTVSANVLSVKVAVTEVALSMATVQLEVVLVQPVQLENTESEAGVAVSVTCV